MTLEQSTPPHPSLSETDSTRLETSSGTQPYESPFTVIGIDFGGTKTDVALADARGNILQCERLDSLADLGPDQILARAGATARRLARDARELYGFHVAAHAAVAPGIVQPDRILLTPNLPGWEGLALSARLANELDVPQVPVANDVRAGALAELRFGALRDADPGLYVSLGTGIAAALTVGGHVVAGAHQAAGEIGYINPGHAPVDAVAAGRAPLEELVGGRSLAERAEELLGKPATFAELFRSADRAARDLAENALTALAVTLANLSALADPARIVVGGGMMADASMILPTLQHILKGATPFPPQVQAARFRKDASLHGAITLALDSLRAHPERSHPSPGAPHRPPN